MGTITILPETTKNPMEKKKLQQELNVLYKEQKNIRRFEASVSLDGERRIY